ncbi:MAG: IS1634 family transposase [Aminipila sp.]
MFLIKEKRKNGTNLCIVQSYRDPVTKVSKTKRIMNLGYLEDLQKQYDDPITHFKNLAKEMSEEYNSNSAPIQIELDPAKALESGVDLIKNFGYTALSSIYHELKIDTFFRSQQRSLDIDYSLNSVMKLLVYGGILFPGSIKEIYSNKNQFFDKMDFTLTDIYRSFTYFHRYKTQLQSWLHERICENYGRNKSQMYYYVTKHYFETNEHDEAYKKSVSKTQRTDPIVQMGLFIDKDGLPVSYELFPRNPVDALILSPEIKKRAQDFGVGKVILVGDNGINSTDNLYYALSSGSGYIVAQSIRGAEKEMKDYVLNQEGYRPFGDECKIKSRIYTRKVRITTANGTKKTVTYDEKQIIFYNKKYARCTMAEREDVLLKAKDLIASPGKYNKTTAYGAAKYVQNIEYDKSTGEIVQGKQPLNLDQERLKEEEKYDGYYLFLTSELDEKIEDLVNAYRGLWEIEESFKYINSTYRARPVFVSRVEHMHAHFLTCFLSLVLTRVLEMKTKNKYPLNQVLNSLRKCNYVHIEGNYYIQSYYDSVLDYIGNSIGIDFSKKYGTAYKIRENIGSTKKGK